jgi:TolA-binding protein
MPNLVSSRFLGAGLRSSSRVPGTRWLVLVFFGFFLSGCATKGDLRSVQDEIGALAAQQRQALEELSGLNLAVQDTLRGQSDALFESRGDVNRRLREIQQEILTLQELLRMNQQSLAKIENLLLSQPAGGMSPTRTDTEPGQGLDVEARAGGPVELYNAAVVQYNNGSLNTARLAFQRFLMEYPYDALADDALYFLADILVQEDRLEEAISAFLRIPELHPTRERVPDALFRVGLIYIELDQLDDAREYLRRVVNTHSDSGAAALARQKLAEIG